MGEPIDLLPGLRGCLAYEPLGEFPTPVEKAEPLSSNLGAEVWVKQDGRASPHYGGNKVRKLEFLLAAAKARGARRILTFGGVGSHHAVACAVHSARVGLTCDVLVVDQPLTPDVRKSLLLANHFGAHLHHTPRYRDAAMALPGLWLSLRRRDGGVRPYLMPPGGSVALGSVGYALAALEIDSQIKSGALPKPDALFVAAGSCGTIAGLLAGAAILRWDVPLVAVRVVDRFMVNKWHIRGLARGALEILEKCGALPGGMPYLPDFSLLGDYFGSGYGAPTKKGAEARRRAREEAGLVLENTYTAKAFAALLDWAAKKENRGKQALFINTHSAVDFSNLLETLDWRELPRPLWQYFDGTRELAEPQG